MIIIVIFWKISRFFQINILFILFRVACRQEICSLSKYSSMTVFPLPFSFTINKRILHLISLLYYYAYIHNVYIHNPNQPHLFVNFPIPKKARHCERKRFLRFARNKSEQSHESLSLRGSKSRGNLMKWRYTLGLPRFLQKLAMTGSKKTFPFLNFYLSFSRTIC